MNPQTWLTVRVVLAIVCVLFIAAAASARRAHTRIQRRSVEQLTDRYNKLETEKRSLGVRGDLVAADDSPLGSPTLRSPRLGLVGRPDALSRVDGSVIPTEYKPFAKRVYRSHVIQLAAVCALVEERYSVRPPYGVLVLSEGQKVRIPYTRELEREMLDALTDMREDMESGRAPGPRWLGGKCEACGYRAVCWGK